jgi:hypothetical protein
VKYMLIIYGNQELWNSIDPAEFQQEIAALDSFNKKFYSAGELYGMPPRSPDAISAPIS